MDVLTAANGCDSTVTTDVTVLPAITSSQTVTLCNGGSVTVGNSTYNTTGVFMDVFTAANGCDSTVTTDVTVNAPIDTLVTIANGNELTVAEAGGASYQWVECDNLGTTTVLIGETNQTFTATANGSYAVEVTVNNCTEVSPCTTVSVLSVEETLLGAISLYPNPTQEITYLELDKVINSVGVTVIDITGRVMSTATYSNQKQVQLNTSNWENGLYMIELKIGDASKTFRLIKQ